ncbi:MAG: TolC family protein [Bacteroidales bacterium]|nr:TolC family protein [Bacteroidales bacterium]MDZ4203348.1 TolC family protein [Bacteroidales bacterium]
MITSKTLRPYLLSFEFWRTQPLIIIILVFINLIPLHAQPLLNLDEAIRVGIENNYDVRIARNERDIAKNNTSAGNAGFLPKVSIGSSYEKSITAADVKVVTGTELVNNRAHTDWIDAGLFVKWTLFDGFGMFIRRDQFQKIQEIGEEAYWAEIEKTIADIIIKYFDIVSNQMLLNVLVDQVELSQLRLQIIESRHKVGSVSEIELLKARVELHADESARANQQALTQNHKTLLNELLARDVSLDFLVADTITLMPDLDLQLIKNTSLRDNRDVLLGQLHQEYSEMLVKQLLAMRLPSVRFFSNYYFTQTETQAAFIQSNRQIGPHLGLSIDFPLFDGFKKRLEVQNALISKENANFRLSQVQHNIQSLVARVSNQYENDLQQLSFERQHLSLAQKNLEIARESFAVGALSSIELREVQKNLMAAQNRIISALYNAKSNETLLLLISGKLMSESENR